MPCNQTSFSFTLVTRPHFSPPPYLAILSYIRNTYDLLILSCYILGLVILEVTPGPSPSSAPAPGISFTLCLIFSSTHNASNSSYSPSSTPCLHSLHRTIKNDLQVVLLPSPPLSELAENPKGWMQHLKGFRVDGQHGFLEITLDISPGGQTPHNEDLCQAVQV